jgi:hypothetical protein
MPRLKSLPIMHHDPIVCGTKRPSPRRGRAVKVPDFAQASPANDSRDMRLPEARLAAAHHM